jgi:hypothetical protein
LRDFRVPAYVHETGPYGQSTHPGDVVPPDEAIHPDGYTPTERDLPVINRGDTVQVPVAPESLAAPRETDGTGALYVVGDVHGYLDELVSALQAQGLVDAAGQWCAGTSRLWFLGDFTDRGPDGIGVIDLVMRLSAEAAAAGGYCKALMGNHELLLLGAKRFGDTPVNSGAGTATFQAAWLLNGGQKTDMDRLQDHHLQWMARLDAVEEVDGYLPSTPTPPPISTTATRSRRSTTPSAKRSRATTPTSAGTCSASSPSGSPSATRAVQTPYAPCSIRTAAHGSFTVTAPFRISSARSGPRRARTAPVPWSRARTSTRTAWPSRWTAE